MKKVKTKIDSYEETGLNTDVDLLLSIQKDLSYIKSHFGDIDNKILNHFVNKDEFRNLKNTVYVIIALLVAILLSSLIV